MRKLFDDDLTKLIAKFNEMGRLTTEAIHRSLRGFVNHDKALLNQVLEDDAVINNLEIEIEKYCHRLIALQQPVTSDLRMIISILKASSDLERMGDHAVSMAQSSLKLNQERLPEIEAGLGEMGVIVTKMADQVIAAFTTSDIEAAKQIAEMDNEVDLYHHSINQETISKMQVDVNYVPAGNAYLSISANLERMGDYTTNICERIIYMNSGKIIELN